MAVRIFDATFSTRIPPRGTPVRSGRLHTTCDTSRRRRPGKGHESFVDGGCLHRDGFWHRVSDRARYLAGYGHPKYNVPALCGRRLEVSAQPDDELYVVTGFVVDVPGVDGAGICSVCDRKWADPPVSDPE